MSENKNEIMNEEQTEIMFVNREDLAPAVLLDGLTNPGNQFYCSIQNDGTRASAAAIYNAVNSKGESLDEHKGEVLEIVNVAAHPVTLVDENTGALVEALRTVLIAKDGKIYDAVSKGIASSLSKIFGIVGMPPWTGEPLRIKVVEQKTRKGRKTNTIEMV